MHSKWLLEFYNHITSETGAEIIFNGWKAAGIYDALKMGAVALPSLDPFQDISPLPGSDDDDHDTRGISDIVNVPVQVKEGFVIPSVDDDDNEESDDLYLREEEDDDDVEYRRNAFDVIIDDEE